MGCFQPFQHTQAMLLGRRYAQQLSRVVSRDIVSKPEVTEIHFRFWFSKIKQIFFSLVA